MGVILTGLKIILKIDEVHNQLALSSNLSGGVLDCLAALRDGLRGLVLDRRRHEALQLLPPD